MSYNTMRDFQYRFILSISVYMISIHYNPFAHILCQVNLHASAKWNEDGNWGKYDMFLKLLFNILFDKPNDI